MAQILAKDILFYVSTDVTAPFTDWKMLVCQDTLSVEMSAETTEVTTKTCGVLVAPSAPKTTISGTFVCEDAPNGTTQVSHQDLMTWLHGNTAVNAKVTKVSDEVKFYAQGIGYFTSINFTADAEGFFTGDFTFVISGTTDITSV